LALSDFSRLGAPNRRDALLETNDILLCAVKPGAKLLSLAQLATNLSAKPSL
jgi:hypothetical protein